jgi:hypothetical protein
MTALPALAIALFAAARGLFPSPQTAVLARTDRTDDELSSWII